MNEIISVVWVGFVGVFAVGRSVHSFIMVDDIIVIFNGFDNHLHNVVGSDFWSFVVLEKIKKKEVLDGRGFILCRVGNNTSYS